MKKQGDRQEHWDVWHFLHEQNKSDVLVKVQLWIWQNQTKYMGSSSCISRNQSSPKAVLTSPLAIMESLEHKSAEGKSLFFFVFVNFQQFFVFHNWFTGSFAGPSSLLLHRLVTFLAALWWWCDVTMSVSIRLVFFFTCSCANFEMDQRSALKNAPNHLIKSFNLSLSNNIYCLLE